MSMEVREIMLPTPDAIRVAFGIIWPLVRRMDLISATALAAGPENADSVAAAYIAGYLDGCNIAALDVDAAWAAARQTFGELDAGDTELPF